MIFESLDQPYREWRERNFPQNDAAHQLLGMVEEVGELSHAYLKKEQGIRGAAGQHMQDMMDAIGDIAIFSLGYVQLKEIDIKAIISHYHVHSLHCTDAEGIFVITKSIGRVAAWHSAPFPETTARVVGNFLGHVHSFAEKLDWDFEGIVAVTASNVLQRDWMANPQDGVNPTTMPPPGKQFLTSSPEHPQQIENHQ